MEKILEKIATLMNKKVLVEIKILIKMISMKDVGQKMNRKKVVEKIWDGIMYGVSKKLEII